MGTIKQIFRLCLSSRQIPGERRVAPSRANQEPIKREPLCALASALSKVHNMAPVALALALIIASGVANPVLARSFAAAIAIWLVTSINGSKPRVSSWSILSDSFSETLNAATIDSVRVIVEIRNFAEVCEMSATIFLWCLSPLL